MYSSKELAVLWHILNIYALQRVLPGCSEMLFGVFSIFDINYVLYYPSLDNCVDASKGFIGQKVVLGSMNLSNFFCEVLPIILVLNFPLIGVVL